ncbi:MAG: ROK family protein [Bacillota bacterium]|nr:ROK family protein [Bacillota bacterium]
MDEVILGIDIGGTKILTGLVASDGRVIDRIKEKTDPDAAPEMSMNQIAASVHSLLNKNGLSIQELKGVAAGCPGPLDFSRGMIPQTPNLNWTGFEIRQALSDKLQCPVFLDNDANMAALGEYCYGEGKGCKHLLYMTISTGIGGGIILDGEVYRGTDGGAGEFGHMVVNPFGPNCRCGGTGCLEAVASGTALARDAQILIDEGKGQGIAKCCMNQPVTARAVGEAARQGDEDALDLIKRASMYLGMALSSLVNVFNPEKIVLGGGVAIGMQDLLLGSLRSYIKEHVFSLHQKKLGVEITSMGEEGVLLGCAAAVFNNRILLGKECERT